MTAINRVVQRISRSRRRESTSSSRCCEQPARPTLLRQPLRRMERARILATARFATCARKDPAFALAWQEAEAEYVGKLEEAMAKWSTTPRRRPVVSGKTGEVVSYDEQPPDPRLLLASLRRHRPDAWNEKKQLEVSGDIQHQVSGGVTMAQIDAQDVMRLPPKEREQFAGLLQQIITLRDEATKVIEHDGPAS